MPRLYPALARWLQARREAGPEIDPLRRARLDELAGFLLANRDRPASLVFVCTHNSRRSQMSQAIASALAVASGMGQLQPGSAGTERTRCHPNALAALRRAGFGVGEPTGDADNPRHPLQLGNGIAGPWLYSKRLDEALDGPAPRAAVMTCSSADAGCPVVPGVELRLSLPYDDPKAADESAGADAAYDHCAGMIAAELGVAFPQSSAG